MNCKIALIGETCIDQYVYGTCDRICPEAAAICFKSNGYMTENFGMSGNVKANLLSINPNLNIDHITCSNIIIKKRFIDTKYNTIVFREDINDRSSIINLSDINIQTYDYIIISDYCKGFLSDQNIIDICNNKSNKTKIFIDTKKKLYPELIKNIDFVKINETEFHSNISNLQEILRYTNLVVTKGEKGATLYKLQTNKFTDHCNTYEENYSTGRVVLRDVCGAGDTFLAGLCSKYIETQDIKTSIIFANACASKVVSKFGVTTI